jgi:4-hydroxymandelate oxidase
LNISEIQSIEVIRQQAYEIMSAKDKARADNYCDVITGAETGASYRRSREALDSLRLRTRLIHGINSVDTSTTVIGTTVKTPILTAPIAGTAIEAYDEVVKACTKLGTMCVIGYPQPKERISGLAGIEDRKVAWIIKPMKDMKELRGYFDVAKETGCIATGMDLDAAVGLQSGFEPTLMTKLAKAYWSFKTVDELKEIRSLTPLPFIVKGIMCVEDAEKCVEAKADAIVVSNHAGYALDFTQAPMEVLPEIVDTVGKKVDVLVDGCMRHGTDVLKALALGAKAVLIGRPTIWGITAGGADGVARVIELMTEELVRAMRLTGVSDVKDVPANILV